MSLVGRDYITIKLGQELAWLRHSAAQHRISPSETFWRKADAIEQYLRNGTGPMTEEQLAHVIDALDTAYHIPPICDDATKATWEPARLEMRAELQAVLDLRQGA